MKCLAMILNFDPERPFFDRTEIKKMVGDYVDKVMRLIKTSGESRLSNSFLVCAFRGHRRK